MHWADTIAEKLAERGSPVIETGTSISGIPHIGNASDVIRGDAVRKALADRGVEARFLWVSDDGDPFRKAPAEMEELGEHLGKPVYDVPDPANPEGSFVKRFAGDFIEELAQFGVTPEIRSGTELYRGGELSDEIKTAFDTREKIIEILNKFRNTKLPQDYVPWTPVCAGCGKISTTRVTGVDGYRVKYVCEDADVSGGQVNGCGHSGESNALDGEGKLPWRVEWPARWHHFKVTCEPFGKDHASAGGSYDTCKIISKEIFGWRPPEPVVYEFLTIGGAKISSSAGNVITLDDWSSIAEAEVLRYFMYKKLNKQRDIDLSKIPNLTDEYDGAEKDFFAGDDSEPKRMYELAQIREPKPCGVPYTLCAVLSQITQKQTPEAEEACQERAEAMGYKPDPNRLRLRVEKSGRWVYTEYCPEHLRFDLTEGTNSGLSDKQKQFLENVSTELGRKWTPETFHKRIYELSREVDLKPPYAFKAVYQALIGKEKGPKAALFLLSLDVDFVRERFCDS